MLAKTSKPLVLLLVCAMFAMIAGCNVMDRLKGNVKDITKEAGNGLIEGIDTTSLDSIVENLVRAAGSSARHQLDSISVSNLQDSLNILIGSILKQTDDSIRGILTDTAAIDDLEKKLNGIISRAGYRINLIISKIIPSALNGQNQAVILGLRDSLLGDKTSELLNQALLSSVQNLAESRHLDSLIRKVTYVIDNTLNETKKDVNSLIINAGITLGVLLIVITLLILWLRNRHHNKRQKRLLLSLTQVIDAIPDRNIYDQTIENLHATMDQPDQFDLLNKLLEEYKDLYPQKRKYRKNS